VRTKKHIREGVHEVSAEERRRQRDPSHNSGALGPDEVYVCACCGKLARSKMGMGSCIGHQVKCIESSIVRNERGRIVSATPVKP
jgi:hypothetical protein